MNKSLALQNNKLFSSYGGVGSMIDTIEDLSIKIDAFDKWYPLYDQICQGQHPDLLLQEPRLCAMVRSIGFKKLDGFFQPDTSLDDKPSFRPYCPDQNDKGKMIQTIFFPIWFYCPKCHRFMPLEDWRNHWTHDNDFDKYAPACYNCGGKKGTVRRPRIQQTRFVLASLETGEIVDIPWRKVFSKHGHNDSDNALVWKFDLNSPESKEVYYHVSNASTNLARIYVKDEHGTKVSMADIFQHYFVFDDNGERTVFKPVVRSDNNVYYAYNLNCIYIPQDIVPQDIVDIIKGFYDNGITDTNTIKMLGRLDCSIAAIQKVIDSNFTVPVPVYTSEDQFRKEEFDFLTDTNNYLPAGDFIDKDRRLVSHLYTFSNNKPKYIKNIYYQSRLNVTTVQIAYSRIDKLSPQCIPYWKGRNDPAKDWYDALNDRKNAMDVALHPTCDGDIGQIEKMPALSSFGEGFLIELDIDYIRPEDREVFLHTFCHLIIKELEFVCGYPAASMSERLYYFPAQQKYGFMIYSVNGTSGSYGGITSLFTSNDIEKILENAAELADDCSNDPICSSEGGHCFACVHLPETACERFNDVLSRNKFVKYR